MSKKKGRQVKRNVYALLEQPVEDQPSSVTQDTPTTSDDNREGDDRPETSPYATEIHTLVVGRSELLYKIPEYFLLQYPKLASLMNSESIYDESSLLLPDVDEDIGHTLVHFLYTGDYQTLKKGTSSSDTYTPTKTEYRQSVLLYCAARSYELHDLETHARRHIGVYGYLVSIFDALDVAREAWPKLASQETWFPEHLKSKVKIAFETDENLFTSEQFLDKIGQVKEFDRTLMKYVAELCRDKISAVTRRDRQKSIIDEFLREDSDLCDDPVSTEDRCEPEADTESPCEPEVEPEPVDECEAEADPTREPEADTESPCEREVEPEPADECEAETDPPCEPEAEPWFSWEFGIPPEPKLQRNDLCPLRRRHIVNSDRWRECKKCRTMIFNFVGSTYQS